MESFISFIVGLIIMVACICLFGLVLANAKGLYCVAGVLILIVLIVQLRK